MCHWNAALTVNCSYLHFFRVFVLRRAERRGGCAYGARDAAGRRSLDPVGRQHIEVHRRAEAARMDVLLGYTSENQLIAISAADIKTQRTVARCPEPSVDQISFMPGGREGVDDIRSHLVAAGPDCGTDRGNEIGGAAAEFALQGVDCRDCDARRGATPPGVHRCHRAGL